MGNRKSVSNPELAALGRFQGAIDRNSNFRQQALNHNLGRNVRVVKLLGFVAMMQQAGVQLRGAVECNKAERQNFSSSRSMMHMGLPTGPMEAAHFLPGQISIDGRYIWSFATSDLARDSIEILFAEVEHLPLPFNQADTAAEAKGQSGGLCDALVGACTALIEHSPRPSVTTAAGRAIVNAPHPNSPVGRSFDWCPTGFPHPNSPASYSFDWFSAGVIHPSSPAGRLASPAAASVASSGWPREAAPRAGISAHGASVNEAVPIRGETVPRQILRVGYEIWHHGALDALENALAAKRSKRGLPPLAGDRFEGYTAESISARSDTTTATTWNRDEAVRILEYYLLDQKQRDWAWVMSASDQIFRELERISRG